MCVGSISGFSCVTHSYRIADNKATVSCFCRNKTACVNYINTIYNLVQLWHEADYYRKYSFPSVWNGNVYCNPHNGSIAGKWVKCTLIVTVFVNIYSYCDAQTLPKHRESPQKATLQGIIRHTLDMHYAASWFIIFDSNSKVALMNPSQRQSQNVL